MATLLFSSYTYRTVNFPGRVSLFFVFDVGRVGLVFAAIQKIRKTSAGLREVLLILVRSAEFCFICT